MAYTDSELEGRLRQAEQRRQAVKAERTAAADSLRLLIEEASSRGWSKPRIADVTGLSRESVYRIMAKR